MSSSRKPTAPLMFSPQEASDRLRQELPTWSCLDGHLQRRYATSGWKSTLMVINTVGHLAEAAWHHPELSASYAWVVVKLMTHDAGGITEKDFQLAKKIEEVVLWRPGSHADSALTGTPDDPRFSYIQYD
jgi:4a-hydroxytetrahydrobiopterin dehydratase